jgi:flagellar hook-basal body complex protein FliE
MSIEAIGAVGSTGGLSALAGLSGLSGTTGATRATSGTADTAGVFGSTLAGAVDNLQAMQANADELAVKAVTGDLNDIHDYTIAASEASVAMELTAALRNKAVDAFTEIMRMQA